LFNFLFMEQFLVKLKTDAVVVFLIHGRGSVMQLATVAAQAQAL
jgi:hypothetical protein